MSRLAKAPTLLPLKDNECVLRATSLASQTLAPELGIYTPTGNPIARTQAASSINTTELRVTLTGGDWYVPIVSGHGSPNDRSNPFTGVNVTGGATGDYEIAIQRGTSTTNPLHNQDVPEDVSGDGIISPLDALMVINSLNSLRNGISPPVSTGSGMDTSARANVPASEMAAAVDDYFTKFLGKLGVTSFLPSRK